MDSEAEAKIAYSFAEEDRIMPMLLRSLSLGEGFTIIIPLRARYPQIYECRTIEEKGPSQS